MRFLVLALLLFSVPAAAQSTEQARATAVKLASDWLAQNTAYKQIPPVRHWVPLSVEKMAAQAGRGGVPTGARKAAAIYSCGNDTMYYQDGVNFMDIAILSLMVHELTHDAQCSAGLIGKRDLCSIEREAYTNQQKFLRALPARLAASGSPLPPQTVAAVNGLVADIDKIESEVCSAYGKK
jgi:hypothetical protein